MTTGVLVMAYGTPASRDEVEEYYTRIRHGRAPSAEQLADLVRRYDAIGGVSPLSERTAAQVAGIQAALDAAQPGEFIARRAQKYAEPFIEDAASELLAHGVSSVVSIVLAPHSSSLSTGQYMVRAAAALGSTPHATIESWWADDRFVALMAQRVRDAIGDLLADVLPYVLFSAHSLPERIVAEGDTYPEQLRASAELVAAQLPTLEWGTAWQSAGRTPEPWLGPDILITIDELAGRGVTSLVSCPIGFTSDHLEVLYDIDIEASARAAAHGVSLVRTASLNDDPRFVGILADLIIAARP